MVVQFGPEFGFVLFSFFATGFARLPRVALMIEMPTRFVHVDGVCVNVMCDRAVRFCLFVCFFLFCFAFFLFCLDDRNARALTRCVHVDGVCVCVCVCV